MAAATHLKFKAQPFINLHKGDPFRTFHPNGNIPSAAEGRQQPYHQFAVCGFCPTLIGSRKKHLELNEPH
jgi:hypothetical protein